MTWNIDAVKGKSDGESILEKGSRVLDHPRLRPASRPKRELEAHPYKHPQLLGELVIISRQTKTGTHHDVPDLIAVDADNNVVIIELKRAAADEAIIAQVLRYAIGPRPTPIASKTSGWNVTTNPMT